MKSLLQNITPFKHQEDCFEKAKDNNFAILMEQGTGKTPIGVALTKHYDLPTVIVCPLSVMYEWKRQLKLYADIDVQIFGGVAIVNKVVITTYQMLHKHWRMLKDHVKDGVLILDESQYIKNPKSHMTQAAWRMGDGVKHKYILTGTPITKHPTDLWAQFRFLDPQILGGNYPVFENEYTIKTGVWRKVVGFKDLDKLGEKIKPFSFRVLKKDCLDLPPEMDNYLWVDLSPGARRDYDRLNTKMIGQFESMLEGNKPRMDIMGKLRNQMHRLSGGWDESLNFTNYNKMDATMEFVEDKVGDGHQIVIFAHFILEVTEIVEQLRKRNITANCIYGEISLKERSLLIDSFQSGGYQVLVCQEKAGGIGITLTNADIAIFYSMNFDAGDYEQAKARIYRIGQKKPVNYVHVITRNSVDELILRIVKRKIVWSDNTLEGIRELLKWNR